MQMLIPELDLADSEWFWQAGEAQLIPANTVLVRTGQPLEALHFLIDGEVCIQLVQSDQNPLGQAFSALEGGTLSGREIARLSHDRLAHQDHSGQALVGQIVAEVPLAPAYLPATQVVTTQPCQILTIPAALLQRQIQQDTAFAARIYQLSAMLLAQRFERMLEQLKHSSVVLSQPQLREALLLFAELHDSDLDWLLSAGQVQKIPSQTVLIQQGYPIEAFHILLSGAIILTASASSRNTLTDVFAQLEEMMPTAVNESPDREFSRLFRGDILGEQALMGIPDGMLTATVLQEAQVLSVHRWRLESKLQHDVAFASRFYRVLAMLLSDRVLSISQRLGYGRLTYSQGDSLDRTFANELSSQFLSSIHIAGARFDWMLKRTQEQ